MTEFIETLSDRKIIEAAGSESADFLNRVLTCNTESLFTGDACFGALLTPQGKIIADLFVYKTNDALLIDVHSSVAEAIQKRLTMLKLRADVQIKARDDLHVILSSEKVFDAVISTHDPRELSLFRTVSQTPLGTSDHWSDIRIDQALPELGTDFETTSTFPADVNMDVLHGIDFKKGCFVGQEVVSRMKRKTEVRKRTCKITSEVELLPGSELKIGESVIGTITSVHGKKGLALIRLDRLSNADAGAPILADNNSKTDVIIPEYLGVTTT